MRAFWGLILGLAWGLASVSFSLTGGGETLRLTLPDGWQVEPVRDARREARSEEAAFGTGENQARLILRYAERAAPLGELPADDAIGTYLDLLKAALPSVHDFAPSDFSQTERFTWGGRSAAVFSAYAPARAGRPAYYGRFWALAGAEAGVWLLEQGLSLPAFLPPETAQTDSFNLMLGTLSFDGQALDVAGAILALDRLDEPTQRLAPPVAALRLASGLEARLAAPQGWTLREVTRQADYPSVYFFADDLRELKSPTRLAGPFAQASLISERRFLAQTGLTRLPPLGERAIAYLNALLVARPAAVTLSAVHGFAWGSGGYAVLVGAEWPPANGLYGAGTTQRVLVVETGRGLALLTFYAPTDEWRRWRPLWAEWAGALVLAGEALPAEVWEAALASFEAPL